jgi:hypothetical protein
MAETTSFVVNAALPFEMNRTAFVNRTFIIISEMGIVKGEFS